MDYIKDMCKKIVLCEIARTKAKELDRDNECQVTNENVAHLLIGILSKRKQNFTVVYINASFESYQFFKNI